MMRRLLLIVLIVTVGSLLGIAQTGAIKITMIDKLKNEPMPFASVQIEQGGNKISANQTNFDGEVTFSNLTPGKYDVKASFVGYNTKQVNGVQVSTDKTTYYKFEMENAGGVVLKEVQVVDYAKPLIESATTTEKTMSRDEFMHNATKDVNSVVAQSSGIFQADNGGSINIRGSRSDATVYYVDGMRMQGDASGVAQLGVEQITVITGGIPASYGDVTGGVIAVTTRGVPSNFFATVQAESSQFLDQYGKNYLGFSLGGPLYSKRDTAGNKKDLVGFIISGDYTHYRDPNASTVMPYQLNAATLSQIQQNPLILGAAGTPVRAGEFVTSNDIQQLQYRQNAASNGLNLNGRLKFRLSENTDLSVGGTFGYGNSNAFVYEYMLFNPDHNPQTTGYTGNINARLTQRFGSNSQNENEKTTAVITNSVLVAQAEYSLANSTTQDPTYQSNIFNYGYIGSFDRIKGQPNFAWDNTKTVNGQTGAFVQQALPGDSIIRFTPSTNNINAANYTSDAMKFLGGSPQSLTQINTAGGLLNGDRPQNIYGLWYPTGRLPDNYSKASSDQFRFSTQFSAIIKGHHNIQVGFEFNQQQVRSFSITPIELWGLMRSLETAATSQMDTAHPLISKQGLHNYISYNAAPATAGAVGAYFDANLRKALNLPSNSTGAINTDALNPNFFTNNGGLSMFSADDLLQSGHPLVSYQGYDYTGNKLSSNPSFGSFFTAQDANGNYTRQVAPYQPIYLAGYVQDQFDIADLKVRAGLRIDRFDNNQEVLKDPYSLYLVKNAGELGNASALGNFNLKSSAIPNNYLVYVDNAANPQTIVGYRSPANSASGISNWYSPQGVLVSDPGLLARNAGISQIQPLLENNQAHSQPINTNAFMQYVPVINVMPRLAFAFPISDLASFSANYDITTQRPTGGNNASPYQYLQWYDVSSGLFMSNPAMKPQQTISYEFAYSQYLNERKTVSLKIAAYYREMRDMIEAITLTGAYPGQYTTYGNLDFGTVKGLAATFDTRRAHNIQLSANYTLQFADGTMSAASAGVNLANAGLPDLRILAPLTYDRRHTINLSVDYRYAEKSEYNGPVWIRHKGKDNEKVLRLFENMGVNVFFTAGSGTPYSRQANVTQGDASGIPVAIGLGQRGALAGSIDGSSLPWAYRFNVKVDKTLKIKWKEGKEGRAAKFGNMTIYATALNLLNTQNILNVYKYTGSSTDDGFLSSATGQQYVANQNSPSSFSALYALKVNYPYNYSSPRSLVVGIVLNY